MLSDAERSGNPDSSASMANDLILSSAFPRIAPVELARPGRGV
jgi:hypothetical protein